MSRRSKPGKWKKKGVGMGSPGHWHGDVGKKVEERGGFWGTGYRRGDDDLPETVGGKVVPIVQGTVVGGEREIIKGQGGYWDKKLQKWFPDQPEVTKYVQQPQGNVSTGNSWRKCPGHDGVDPVHQYADGTVLSGAGQYDLHHGEVDLLLDFVGVDNSSFVKGIVPAGFEELLTFGVIPRVVKCNWPDRTSPWVGAEFWRKLRKLFVPGWHVVLCCMGGHGRTGTGLASLLIEDGWTAQDAIDWVRTVHCSCAIETKGQEEYLVRLAEEFDRIDGVAGEEAAAATVVETAAAE